MTTLWLVRHGETDDNRQLVFQGQGGRGLNARGVRQAQRLAARLARWQLDAIVSSDLERAVETANIVARAQVGQAWADRGLGRSIGSAGQAVGLGGLAAVTLDPDLREIDVGTWTGRGYAEMEAADPEAFAAWTAGLDVRRGGGETYAELAVRVDRAIERVLAAWDHEDDAQIVVVSHGGSIKGWVARLLGLAGPQLRALGGVSNTGIVLLDRRDRTLRLRAWNDAGHLEGSDDPRA